MPRAQSSNLKWLSELEHQTGEQYSKQGRMNALKDLKTESSLPRALKHLCISQSSGQLRLKYYKYTFQMLVCCLKQPLITLER